MKSTDGEIRRFSEAFYQAGLPVVESGFAISRERTVQLHGAPIAHSPEALEYCSLSVISEQMKLSGDEKNVERDDSRHRIL